MNKDDKKDFSKHITKYLSEYLPHERNLSSNTIASYRDTFIQFIDYMKIIRHKSVEHIRMSDVNKENIVSFLNWIIDDKKCSIATSNYRLAALHSFVRYVQYIDIDKLNQWQEIL